jgi:hypothetical protein
MMHVVNLLLASCRTGSTVTTYLENLPICRQSIDGVHLSENWTKTDTPSADKTGLTSPRFSTQFGDKLKLPPGGDATLIQSRVVIVHVIIMSGVVELKSST